MGIDFENKMMNKSARKLYKAIWEDNDFVRKLSDKIVPSDAGKRRISCNSYSFVGDNKEKMLAEIFGIKDRVLFHQKFEIACGGYGMEYRRINTLHSSSLCALLFFYNVTEYNPIEWNLEGRQITFTKSVFEYKSPVITNASNMDVVLAGVDGKGKEVVLFLESKFSEYYTSAVGKLDGISYAYVDNNVCEFSPPFYKKDFLKSVGIKREIVEKKSKDGKTEKTITLQTVNNNKLYLSGFKQMVSHYVGICNDLNHRFYDGEKTNEQLEIEQILKDGADVILGEILFDSRIGELEIEEGKSVLDSYSETYEKLAERMNNEIKKTRWKNRFKVLRSNLKYSQFISDKHSVEEEIMLFYNLRKG